MQRFVSRHEYARARTHLTRVISLARFPSCTLHRAHAIPYKKTDALRVTCLSRLGVTYVRDRHRFAAAHARAPYTCTRVSSG